MMNTKTMRKAARDLVPGDVLPEVVGANRIALATQLDGDCAHILTARFGQWFEKNDPCIIKHSIYPADAFYKVLPAGLTPVQAAADKLLAYAWQLYGIDDALSGYEQMELRTLLDELDPPKPPTLEEAIAVLREMTDRARSGGGIDLALAQNLLARVPK